MKKIFLIALTFIVISNINAQIFIHQIINKDNDPITGKILLKDDPLGCPPYTIQVKGRTTLYNETRNNQNPGPNGTIEFLSLEADKYDIKVSNSNGCVVMLNAEIRNCTGFEITMDIPLTCNSNHVLVQANIDVGLRIPAIKYEWINKNGSPPVYYWNNNVTNLYPGNYIVKITDDNGLGCMSMNEFSVANFSFNVSHAETKICKEKDECLIKVMDNKGMTFPNRSFNYLWSDGVNVNGNSVVSRELNVSLSYTLTVTDLMTQCTRIVSIPIGPRVAYPEYALENCKLFSLKHYYDANDKGTASFIFSSLLVPTIKCQLYSKESANGSWIPGNSYTVNSNRDILKLQWMLPRYYKLCVFDSKIECEEGCVEFQILECDGIKNQVAISVQDKILPMDDPNFFIRVGVVNSGGPCMYKYYMGSDPNNSPNYILKSGNSIDYTEGLKIFRSGFNDIGIQAICPCGISKITVNVFPCNKDWKLKAIEELVVNLCSGTLPDNTQCNYNLTGSVKLVIDVTKNFNKVGAAGYIKSMKWDDNGADAQFVQNNNIITITRDFQEVGDYYLTFIDGLNCRYSHKVSIKQGFKYVTKGYCTYLTYCDDTYKETFKRATITLVNEQSCLAQITCGGSAYPLYGRKVKGEWLGNKQNGMCEFESYCVFETGDEFINSYDLVSNFKLLGKPYFDGVAINTGFVEGPCCKDNNYFNEASIFTNIQRIDNIDHGEFGLQTNLNEELCISILECDNGYYIIHGTPLTPYKCRYGLDCYMITDCVFSNVGKVNDAWINISSESIAYRRLRNEIKLVPSDCDSDDPNCIGIATLDDVSSRSKQENFRVELIPNPFNDNLDIRIAFRTLEKRYSIRIHDLLGKVVYQHEFFLNSSDLEIKSISTINWRPGLYLVSIQAGIYKQIFRIVKME